jgi:hypothetical protein
MGRGGASKKWLRGSAEQTSSESVKPEDTSRINLLETMRTAMQGGKPQAAVAVFMEWAPKSDEVCPSKAESVGDIDRNFDKVNAAYVGL